MNLTSEQNTRIRIIKEIRGMIDKFYYRLENRRDQGSDEQTYFNDVIKHVIGSVSLDIYIFGYDAPFMKRADTISALKDAIEKKGGYGEGANVYAIFPELMRNRELEEIAEGNDSLTILRAPYAIDIGFITSSSGWSFAIWDQNKPTIHTPEEHLNAPFRFLGVDEYTSDRLRKLHQILYHQEARIRNITQQ